MAVYVTSADGEDFREAAELHQNGITEGFLSTLGVPFLAALYQGIAAVEGSGVLVASNDGKILGFLAYTSNVKTCYKNLLRSRWPVLAWKMVPNIVRPSIYRKVVETLMYPFVAERSGREAPAEIDGTSDARPELLAMAVSESARGQGVGKRLVEAMDDAMRAMHIEGCYVVTHGIDERSNRFYASCGFEKVAKFENHGRPMNEYYRRLA